MSKIKGSLNSRKLRVGVSRTSGPTLLSQNLSAPGSATVKLGSAGTALYTAEAQARILASRHRDGTSHRSSSSTSPCAAGSNSNATWEELMQAGQGFPDISHAGGEMDDMLSDEDLGSPPTKRPKRDHRTRRDRQMRQNAAYEIQMDGIVLAYMTWVSKLDPQSGLEHPPPAALEVMPDDAPHRKLCVMDTYRTYTCPILISNDDANIPAAILRHGLVPSAPISPRYAVSIRALETYRVIHLRCPHLGIEPYVKALCDVYQIPYKGGLRKAFSKCLDLYLRLRDETLKRVEAALNRPHGWRLKNACSGCTYFLEDEPELLFKILTTMDGNESLKRLARRKDVIIDELLAETPEANPTGDPSQASTTLDPPESTELADNRPIPGDFYIPRATVDKFRDEGPAELIPPPSSKLNKPEPVLEENPCASRWKNMQDTSTAKSWGIFDENGIFLCLCRHGNALAIADMVRSGEQTRYPLAVVELLLETFGSDIGCGYDVGCRFKTTLANSSLGQRAKEKNFTSLVGAFHGHAHNRVCQLQHLATYVVGLGLEDLEGCERFFSKSNALARSLRHASAFHRMQKIVEYLQHMNAVETAQSLSKFIVDNYKQALEILGGEMALRDEMKALGIDDPAIFDQWRAEELQYLKSLTTEPAEETQKIEYFKKLRELTEHNEFLGVVGETWVHYDPQRAAAAGYKVSSSEDSVKKQRDAAIRRRDQLQRQVHALEVDMGILVSWKRGSREWVEAEALTEVREYRRALDHLEALVVSRIFELSKMNLSQTGYKLRRHIAKNLQARSQAIRTALQKYNAAARRLKPPKPTLSWDNVVNYAFLSDFDLLRDAREDITDRPWAKPAARLVMDRYCKIQRAREEITRLNVEIRRIITHMQDENQYLAAAEKHVALKDPVLAHHIGQYRRDRLRFSQLHLNRFKKLATTPGFTGTLSPGVPIDKTLRKLEVFPAAMVVDGLPDAPAGLDGVGTGHAGGSDDEGSDDESIAEADEFNEAFSAMLAIVDQ